jgi:hypothetical protein
MVHRLRPLTAAGVLSALLIAGPALAQGVGAEVQRDINQQQRIEDGLTSGRLTTGEAARLERGESRIDRMESNARKDGTLSPGEKARIARAQHDESRRINRLSNNTITGDPDSPSSRRMQADVRRNIDQEQRIRQGIQSRSLTNREVGRLERGQSRITQREARAGRDGYISRGEQRGVQHAENRQSRQIYREKHDTQTRFGQSRFSQSSFGQSHYGRSRSGQSHFARSRFADWR